MFDDYRFLNRRSFVSTILGAATASRYHAPGYAAEFPRRPHTTPSILTLAPSNSKLAAQICPEMGGMLAGLQYQSDHGEVELLYRGLDFSEVSGWSGKAPFLWPAVGRTAEQIETSQGEQLRESWSWHQQDYSMPMHGFAMSEIWSVESLQAEANPAVAILRLNDTSNTRRMYPFGFEIDVKYGVSETRLDLKYRIKAAKNNMDPMPFSLGNHLTFNVPLVKGANIDEINVTSSAKRLIQLTTDKLPSGTVLPIDLSNPKKIKTLSGVIATSVGSCPPGDIWAKLADPAGLYVRVSHNASWLPEGEPVLFNLWGDAGKGYFAIEPWCGKQNALVTGDGLTILSPGAEFEWAINVEVGSVG